MKKIHPIERQIYNLQHSNPPILLTAFAPKVFVSNSLRPTSRRLAPYSSSFQTTRQAYNAMIVPPTPARDRSRNLSVGILVVSLSFDDRGHLRFLLLIWYVNRVAASTQASPLQKGRAGDGAGVLWASSHGCSIGGESEDRRGHEDGGFELHCWYDCSRVCGDGLGEALLASVRE